MPDPLVLPLLALVCGILLGNWIHEPVLPSALALGAFTSLGALAHHGKSRFLARTCLGLACLSAGLLAVAAHDKGPRPTIDAGSREVLILEGCVVDPPLFSADRGQFTLELDKDARARVTIPLDEGEADPRLEYGQRIEIDAKIRPPRNYWNPGSFDYASYLARQNIYWTAVMDRHSAPRILPGRCGNRAMGLVYRLRTAALQRLESLYGEDTYSSGMMKAILIGDSSSLEKVWTQDFRRTGTFHALVISGVHVTVLAGVLLFLLRVCGFPQIPSLTLTAAAAWLYALVSGMSAPVVRAAGGFTLYLIARFFFRRTRVLNLLAAISIVYLLWDPAQLYDASFQLSFLSVAAIGALAAPLLDPFVVPMGRGMRSLDDTSRDVHLEPFVAQARVELRLAAETIHALTRLPTKWAARALSLVGRLFFFALEMVILSAVIQVGLALPMAELFHRVSFTGLSANLLIVPLLNMVVPLGFIAIFSGWAWVAKIAAFLLTLAARIATWHARAEPSWRIPDPPLWLALGFVAALLLSCVLVHRRIARWPAIALVLAMFTLLLWQPFPAREPGGILELTAIDVSQGDSLLLRFPRGALMVIDGGGFLQYGKVRKSSFDTGEEVVSPYLWSRGIRRIDVLVSTHNHEDHTGGLKSILENFRPAELWVGTNPSPALVEEARRLGVKVVQQHLSQPFQYSGTTLQILSPPEDYPAVKPGNNDSLAFKVTYGSRSYLLTGDMERPMESLLLAEDVDLYADVLKVGHHGSRTSTIAPFLAAVAPTIAIVSAGYENSFGHPHPDVMRRLTQRPTTILRTDYDGLVTVRTDGRNLTYSMMAWDDPSGARQPRSAPFNPAGSPAN